MRIETCGRIEARDEMKVFVFKRPQFPCSDAIRTSAEMSAAWDGVESSANFSQEGEEAGSMKMKAMIFLL